MAMKTTACRILDTLKIPYTLHEYDWDEDSLDAVTVAGKLGISPEQIFKTLVVRGDKTGVFMVCIPGNKKLDLKVLATVSKNKKVEMVPVNDLQALTGYIRGGVSPLGVKKRYPIYIDESVEDLDPVIISGGRRGLSISLKGADLVRACKATLCPTSRS
ncbi:Cys-tRNA(Pro)/Cys-tRNA(Cys) deacylase [Collibacillus ludicampi]|uniref:Cys-tRNA(Pro)/Cys-tRNA(Cys) deacylase n=1 Tax=Collibacillus ludicampi TaxID=2771369 RepID=A0AAV4LEZ6_9BACL|nr:Cys-tRNA(Pro) deacylase [Collibacillus ludicampi]GIM46430.1 Cys-tRNA(Pro)/Cys-tRNA(Cys) deacylase [Collibacillus ludicampi]